MRLQLEDENDEQTPGDIYVENNNQAIVVQAARGRHTQKICAIKPQGVIHRSPVYFHYYKVSG
jgi:hypothetical protein